MRKSFMRVVLIFLLFLFTSAIASSVELGSDWYDNGVTIEGVKFHLKVLDWIARFNNNNRASGTQGYEMSARYVKHWLSLAGYTVTVQEFEFPYFEETTEPMLEQVFPYPKTYPANDPEGFNTMRYSGSGDVTARIQPVDIMIPPGATPNSSTSGCEPEDFKNFIPGNIALIQRGTCYFKTKALNAQNAGAVGVIIFNEGQEGRTAAISGNLIDPELTIPVVGASYAVGEELYELSLQGDVMVRLMVDTINEIRITSNIIAETEGEEDDETTETTVMIGAHLDSVLAGPGINDNGSGTAAILDTALRIAWMDDSELRNKLRFAFWGAEESGLLGSTYYVENLSKEELDKIAFYLNFDMIGSPNYVRFVYDGDGSETGEPGPPGSDMIEKLFVNFFTNNGLATEPTAFTGRSDYEPFMDVGIPVGGLFTGAEGIKTVQQAEIYGGTPGEPYDPCYHTPCDSIENINFKVEKQMVRAIMHAVYTLGMRTLPLPQYWADRSSFTAESWKRTLDREYRGPYLIK